MFLFAVIENMQSFSFWLFSLVTGIVFQCFLPSLSFQIFPLTSLSLFLIFCGNIFSSCNRGLHSFASNCLERICATFFLRRRWFLSDTTLPLAHHYKPTHPPLRRPATPKLTRPENRFGFLDTSLQFFTFIYIFHNRSCESWGSSSSLSISLLTSVAPHSTNGKVASLKPKSSLMAITKNIIS